MVVYSKPTYLLTLLHTLAQLRLLADLLRRLFKTAEGLESCCAAQKTLRQ